MSASTTIMIVPIQHKISLVETLLENKKTLLIGSAMLGSAMLVIGLSVGIPIGAFIYDRITNAGLASYPCLQGTNSSFSWETPCHLQHTS